MFVIAVITLSSSFASNPDFVKPSKKKLYASEIMIPVGSAGQKISLLDLATIERGELEKITGRKMKLAEQFAFKASQKKLRSSINKDGVVTDKKIKKMFYRGGETGFHLGGFALGFFVGLIGVLIAYLIKDDYKKNRVKWAWIGVGVGLVLAIIFALAV